jgi:UDP-N-acetylenolpyruvoylglucosamine reductase
MAYEMKPSSGSLFKNDRKEKETHPDLKGKVMLPNGEVRWVSAWKKKTAAGETWLSLALGDLVQQAGGSNYGGAKPLDAHNTAKANAFVSDDSDIPF